MVTLDFDKAKCVREDTGTWLCLKVKEEAAAYRFANEMKNTSYIAEIKMKREKRSLNANAYAWKLLDQLADAVGSTKEELYRRSIKDVGVFRDFPVTKDEIPFIKTLWEKQGTGWITELVDYQENGDDFIIRCYYGSSTYNTKQMSRLIDYIVEDCQSVGIETKTPDEIALMKARWHDEQ